MNDRMNPPWFLDFMAEHMEWNDRADWPATESEFYVPWRDAFVRRGITREMARRASMRMAERSPSYLSEHLPKLLELCESLRAEDQAAFVGGREEAEQASRECPDCGGTGFATRHSHKPPLPPATEGGPPRPRPAIPFHCLCPRGRWLARAQREGRAGEGARVPDLADRPDLQMGRVAWSTKPDNRWRYPLNWWDAERGRPIEPSTKAADPAEVINNTRRRLAVPKVPFVPFTAEQHAEARRRRGSVAPAGATT